MYFLGDRNAGKTSLVKSLIGENASLADKPSEGTSNYIWRPFRDNSKCMQRNVGGQYKSTVSNVP